MKTSSDLKTISIQPHKFRSIAIRSIATRSINPAVALMIIPIMIIAVALTTTAYGQSEEIALMEQVQTLIDDLDSTIIEDRDSAQAELESLQPAALDFIDVPSDDATTDFIERLLAVRKTLEAKAVKQATEPTQVSLQGTFSVTDALKKIRSQTKNNIALREGIELDAANGEIKLELKSVPFWEAVHAVMLQANLEVDVYGGTVGSVVLVPRSSPPTEKNDPLPVVMSPRTTTGVLAVEVSRVVASRVLTAPNLDFTTLDLLIRWEPRVQPISLQLKQANLKIVDDQGNTIPTLRQTPISSAVQTEIPELNFPINLPLVKREVNQIKSVSGTLDAVLPGRIETFRFRGLKDIADGTSQTKSGATVTMQRIQTNEELFGVTIALSFDEQSNEVDSHQGWTFENDAYLVDPADPKIRHESVAYETVARNGQQVSVEYYFEVDPDAFDLVYQTPAAIVSVSFDFELKNIPLP